MSAVGYGKVSASQILQKVLPPEKLKQDEAKILAELNAAQGKPVDLGGYYRPAPRVVAKAMRPSPTLNAIVDTIS